MKPRIYVETSVISYLAARPSADAISATRQHFSFQLWQRREALSLSVSEAVRVEAAMGDEEAARTRLTYCNALPTLSVPEGVDAVVQHLLRSKAVPAKAFTDAVHIAIAALHEIEFVASWNFRHIAGAVPRRNIERALGLLGVAVPTIATPEEILESYR